MPDIGPLICIRPERDSQGSEATVEILDGRMFLTVARSANGRDVFATIPTSSAYARLIARALVRTADQLDRMAGAAIECEGDGKGGVQ